MKVNNCSELIFSNHLTKALIDYEERNKIYRWNMVVDLKKFGFEDIEFKQKNIPFIISPYADVDFQHLRLKEIENYFIVESKNNFLGTPKVFSIIVDNYQGTITVRSLLVNKVEWYLDNEKIKTKYNVVGPFTTILKVENFAINAPAIVLPI